MNKTFKVVFNKVRGALIAVNEATSSVQKKGTKTVVAAAVLSAVCGAATAADGDTLQTTTLTDRSNETYDVTNKNEDYFGGKSNYSTHVTAKNVTFSGNKLLATQEKLGDGAADAQGGALYLHSYGKTKHENTRNVFENVKFENNAVRTESNQGNRAAAYGGALVIKGGDTAFKDTVFSGNTATAASQKPNTSGSSATGGGSAAGGAVFVDSTRNAYNYKATVTFDVDTDGLVNKGNTVSSGLAKPFTDGYSTKIPTAGGFLYMDRDVTVNFDVAEGVTYTIGAKDAYKTDKNMDSIASSVLLTSAKHGQNVINKVGAGTLLMHGSMNDYLGHLNVEAGNMTVTSDWAIANAVTVRGGVLELGNFSFTDVKTASGYDGSAGGKPDDVVADAGKIDVKGGKLLVTGETFDLTKVTVAQDAGLEFNGQTIDADANGSAQWILLTTNNGGTVTLNKISASNQTATAQGSVLYLNGTSGTAGGSLAIIDSTFADNTSNDRSGAIEVNNSEYGKTHTAAVKIANSTFTGNKTVQVAGNDTSRVAGAMMVRGANITIDNSTFTDNEVQTSDGFAEGGGALYVIGWGSNKTFAQNNGKYTGNKVTVSGALDKMTQQSLGGAAIVVKGMNATFTDVAFNDNVVDGAAATGTKFAAVTGGAVAADYSTGSYVDGSKKGMAASVTFKATKDMIYSGNTVKASDAAVEQGVSTNYGYVSPTQAGGFLMLHRGSDAAFDVAEGATLTIGAEGTTGDTDAIASDLASSTWSGDSVYEGWKAQSSLAKTGKGTLVINSTLNKYFGTLTVAGGLMQVNTDWTTGNAVTVEGGELALQNLTIDLLGDVFNAQTNSKGKDQLLDSLKTQTGSLTVKGGTASIAGDLAIKAGTVSVEGGTLKVAGGIKRANEASISMTAGVLDAKSTEIFTNFNQEKTALTGTIVKENMTGGVINLSDFTGEYTVAYLAELTKLLGGAQVTMTNGTLKAEDANLSDVVTAGANTSGADVAATADDTGAITVANGNNAAVGSLIVTSGEGDTAASSLSLQNGTFTIAGGLNGQTKKLVSGNLSNDFVLNVGSTSDADRKPELVLGFDDTSSGTLDNKVNVNQNGKLTVKSGTFNLADVGVNGTVNVANGANLTIGKLEGNGNVLVGNETGAGSLSIADAGTFSGLLVFDPAFTGNDTVRTATTGEVLAWASSGLAAKVAVGQNSFVSLGAEKEAGYRAFEAIETANGLTWGQNGVTAAAYVNKPFIFATSGRLWVDGSKQASEFGENTFDKQVYVAGNGLLMVNQANAGEQPYFTNYGESATAVSVNFANGSYLGIVNATEGSFTLAGTVTGTPNVVTDNPFFSGALDTTTGTVTMAFDADGGLAAVASTGLQAMTRRADFTMAQTIADRASTDQQLQPGMNLWVDLAGETYKSDDLDHGGDFEADVFYGAFGGDVKVADDYTVGAAFQYGTGTLRSGVSAIKNAIDNYGLSLYGTAKYGSAKILGELAYVWGENDITSAQTALNGSVDTTMYSAGVTGMYELQAGGFTFVPSIGVRVSRLETDAMQVGAFRVEDQDQTLVQIPIALRINGADMAAGGWKFAPSFKIAYVPTFGDKEIEVLGHETDVIDTNPVQIDFGVRAGTENLLVNAAFAVGAGHNGTSSVGGKIGLKYAF